LKRFVDLAGIELKNGIWEPTVNFSPNNNILIVDDDLGQLSILKTILEFEKFAPRTCTSGDEAIKMLRDEPINVVLLDLRLENENGMALLNEMQRINPDIKVIIHTAYASVESAIDAINKKVFAYVRKMDPPHLLVAQVHQAFYEYYNDYIRKLELYFFRVQKMEALGRLAGGVAHEFNNLLTAIMTYAAIGLTQQQVDDPIRQQLVGIEAAAERAARLVRQLLIFSRQQSAEFKVIDLNEVVSSMYNLLARLVSEKAELIYSPGVGPQPIRADWGQIEQILLNLILNARDAMPQGGQITIKTSSVSLSQQTVDSLAPPPAVAGSYVVLKVSDTGIGMPAEIREQIFEPLFTTKSREEGSGMGLAMVFGAVKQHGGWIEVQSEVGVGTTFSLFFPQAVPRQEGVSSPPGQASQAQPAQGSETILLVESEPLVREAARQMLATLGYQVLACEKSAQARHLALIHSGPIDLLMTDLILHDINGRDLATQIRSYRPDIKVLYCSAFVENVGGKEGDDEKELNFLLKPFSLQTLAAKLREIFDKKISLGPGLKSAGIDTEALRRLPPQLIDELIHAVLELDQQQMGAVIARIIPVDSVLGNVLKAHADCLQYTSILSALQRVAPNKEQL
jgi:signal transduction histidine kinase